MLSTVLFDECLRNIFEAAISSGTPSLAVEIGPAPILIDLAKAALPFKVTSAVTWVASLEQTGGQGQENQFAVAESAVQRYNHQGSFGRGGRLSSHYKPSLMPWRDRRGQLEPRLAGIRSGKTNSEATRVDAESVLRVILSVLAKDSEAAHSQFDENSTLTSLGLDSLGALAARDALIHLYGLSPEIIPSTLLLELQTVKSVVEWLSAKLSRRGNDPPSTSQENYDPHFYVKEDQLPEGAECCVPASSMQQGMLFHSLRDPESRSFIETFVWNIQSPNLDVGVFKAAWKATLAKHAVLRASFDAEATPYPTMTIWTLEAIDTRSEWFSEDNRDVAEVMEVQRSACLDFLVPPLLKVSVVSPAGTPSSFVVFTAHHCLLDGASMKIIMDDISGFYSSYINAEGGVICLQSSVESSYARYAQYEYDLLHAKTNVFKKKRESLENYWRTLMADWKGPSRIAFCESFLNCDVHSDAGISRARGGIEGPERDLVLKGARKCDVWVSTLCHTAFVLSYAALTSTASSKIARNSEAPISGQQKNPVTKDIVYGLTSSGRSCEVSECSRIVGPVINTFPVRVKLAASRKPGSSVAQLAQGLQAQIMSSMTHESLPLTEIQRQVSPEHRGKRMFNAVFDYQQEAWDLNHGDLCLTGSNLLDSVGVPLTLRVVHEVSKGLIQLHATSESQEFGPDRLNELLQTFRRTLLAISRDPNALESDFIPTPEPVAPVAPPCPLDPRLLHEPFLEHVNSSRSNTAVRDCGDGTSLSYGELEQTSRRVGQELCELLRKRRERIERSGHGQRVVVAVVMEKGWEQVVAVLGIHRAQCAYLPVDARLWPEQRIRKVLELSGSSAVVCQSRLLEVGHPSSHTWLRTIDIPVLILDDCLRSEGIWKAIVTGNGGKTSTSTPKSFLSKFLSSKPTSTKNVLDNIASACSRDLAYLIYTSGSTGVPKGVCCHHQGSYEHHRLPQRTLPAGPWRQVSSAVISSLRPVGVRYFRATGMRRQRGGAAG